MILISPDGTRYLFASNEEARSFLAAQLPGHGFKTLEEFTQEASAKREVYEARRRQHHKAYNELFPQNNQKANEDGYETKSW